MRSGARMRLEFLSGLGAHSIVASRPVMKQLPEIARHVLFHVGQG